MPFYRTILKLPPAQQRVTFSSLVGMGYWWIICRFGLHCRISDLDKENSMLRMLNRCSKGRTAWLLLALTALALELTALWFQHVMGLKPCVMCIYERCALLGVLLAGLVGALAPATPFRFIGIIVWLIGAGEGVRLSWEHTMLQVHPPLFATCDFMARFPSWLPLDKWVPGMFVASGNCLDRSWTLFNLSMPEWLLGIFVVYLLVAVLVLIAQLSVFSRRK